MKILTYFIGILAITTGMMAIAGGITTIKGKLTSITETQYRVETANAVYYIKRSAVSERDARTLSKTGVVVSLTAPFEAIEIRNKADSSAVTKSD